MARRYEDDNYVVYKEEEPDAPPISTKTKLVFVSIVVLIVVIGSVVLFKDELFPPPPPPKEVTVQVTTGSQYIKQSLGGQATRLAVQGNNVWAIIPATKTVVKFDTEANKITAKTKISQTPNDLTVGRGGIWVSGTTSVFRLDAQSGVLTKEIPTGNVPSAIVQQGDNVWVINTGDDTVSRIYSPLGKVLKTIPIAPSAFAIDASEQAIWVAHGSIDDGIASTPIITQLNPKTGKVVRQFDAQEDLRGIAVTETSLWTINGVDQGLGKYSMKTGKQIGDSLIRLPGQPTNIYEANNQLYVTVSGKPNRILVLDRVSGKVLEQKEVDEKPISDLVANEAGVWLIREGTRDLVRWQQCSDSDPCQVKQLQSQE